MLRIEGGIDVAVYRSSSCLFYVNVLDEDAGGQVKIGSFLRRD